MRCNVDENGYVIIPKGYFDEFKYNINIKTPMLNIQQLQKNLQAGKHVIVKCPLTSQHVIISPFTDENGGYRNSGHRPSIQGAIEKIGSYSGDWKENFKEHTFIGIYESEFETFKVGDKVLISKDAEKWCEKMGMLWTKEKEGMVGEIVEIKSVPDNGTYFIGGWNFPPQALSYPMEEEDEVEKAIKLLVERGKIKDGKILI